MRQWPVNKAYLWERAPFFRLLLPLIAGIASYSFLHPALNILVPVISICLVFYLATAFVRKQGSIVRLAHFTLLHLLIFLSAWLLCHINDVRNNKYWFGKQLDDAEAFVAIIASTPVEKEKTWKLEVELIGGIENNKTAAAKGKALVYVFKNQGDLKLRQGDTVFVPNKWQAIKNAGNPFEFDYAAYAGRHNLYYQQFLPVQEIKLYKNGNSIAWADKVHNWCMLQLQSYIHDSQTLGLIQAMLVGDEANLDNDLRQAYSETGIIHIIAISGSHIAFFFFIITFLFGWMKNKKYQWLKYALALPLIWAYVLISGAPPSAVRAAIMFSILGIGFALQKQPNSLNQLFAAAFFLLFVQPMWLYSVGFQLSFIAVLSLILFYSPIYQLLKPGNAIARALWGTVVASIAAEILVAPLVIYYFHLFPLMFLVANVAAFLFMGIVLIAGMLIILFSFAAPVAGMLAGITTWLAGLFHSFVFSVQAFNPRAFLHLNISLTELLLVYAFIVFTAVYLFHRKLPALFTALATCCLLLVSVSYHQWQALHQQRLVVYNINRVNHIELIRGRSYFVLAGDTSLTDKQRTYSLKPAHIGWYAWKEKPFMHNGQPLSIAGKSVLILDTPETAKWFHADYVIINFKPKGSQLAQINELYSPEKIILGSHISRSQAQKCKAACDSLHIPLHATQTDGAFVLSAL